MKSPHPLPLLSSVLLCAALGCSSPGDEAGGPDGGDRPDRPDRTDRRGEEDAAPDLPRVVPSNADDLGELVENGMVLGPPSGSFDTDDDCEASSVLGACEAIALADDRADVCVCRADEVHITDLTVTGSRALAIFAYRQVTVSGELVVSGAGATERYEFAATSTSGGAGGSFGSAGGRSSASTYGEDTIIPLVGGMRGQDSCNSRPGGFGGGALQITAGESVTVTGSIRAPGGGGGGGSSSGFCLGGAGGGSGGALLVEAPTVERPNVVPKWSKTYAPTAVLFDAVPNEMSAAYNPYLKKHVAVHT